MYKNIHNFKENKKAGYLAALTIAQQTRNQEMIQLIQEAQKNLRFK